jgi:hypothetical protein
MLVVARRKKVRSHAESALAAGRSRVGASRWGRDEGATSKDVEMRKRRRENASNWPRARDRGVVKCTLWSVKQSNNQNSNKIPLPVEHTASYTRVFILYIFDIACSLPPRVLLVSLRRRRRPSARSPALCLEQALRVSAGSKSSPVHPSIPSIHPARANLLTPPSTLRLIIPSAIHPSIHHHHAHAASLRQHSHRALRLCVPSRCIPTPTLLSLPLKGWR